MGIANRENNPRKNSEGYSDPTAFEALRNIDKEDERFLVPMRLGDTPVPIPNTMVKT